MRGLLGAALFLCAGQTLAAPPQCADGGRKQGHYQAGRAQGHKLVESAWAGLGQDCERRDDLDTIVLDALARLVPPPGSGEALLCRYQGVEDGAGEELAEIATSCQGS